MLLDKCFCFVHPWRIHIITNGLERLWFTTDTTGELGQVNFQILIVSHK